MKANEFRIGNLVNHNIFGTCKITALDYEMICIQRNDLDIKEWFDFDSFKEIPLKHELLINFINFFNENYTFEIKKTRTNVFFNGIYLTSLDYVHELQNLYFLLNNNELILNN